MSGGPLTLLHDAPSSALAIGAHPDDVEFGAGGTLARWADAGCVVHHLVLTDGSKGSWDRTVDQRRLVATRQDEQREAARRLGATGEVRFLDRTDGELEAGVRERLEVARAIRELRPEAVLGHDPWRRYRLHPDHRAAGWLVCDGVVAAREPTVQVAGLDAWRPALLLLWEADEPDVAVDVGAHVEVKLQALLAHESQYESTMGALDSFGDLVRSKLAGWGARAGVEHAEAFTRIDEQVAM